MIHTNDTLLRPAYLHCLQCIEYVCILEINLQRVHTLTIRVHSCVTNVHTSVARIHPLVMSAHLRTKNACVSNKKMSRLLTSLQVHCIVMTVYISVTLVLFQYL